MPSISAARSIHLPCSAAGIAPPASQSPSNARAIGGAKRSLTKTPTATATSTARNPSRSRRATLDGTSATVNFGSAKAESTAAAAMRPAMKRYTSGQLQPPPWFGSTQMKAMPPETIIAKR